MSAAPQGCSQKDAGTMCAAPEGCFAKLEAVRRHRTAGFVHTRRDARFLVAIYGRISNHFKH